MIILASKSPRRKEILTRLGIAFEVMETDTDESICEPLSPSEYTSVVAKRKAVEAVKICMKKQLKNVTIIAADTVVSIEDMILGKPKDKSDAFCMLKLLSDKWHEVYTGLCIAFIKDNTVEYTEEVCLTSVRFKPLTDNQIKEYVSTDEPYDKAGAYAIQGDGGEFIEKIDGDYNNVVGLPIEILMKVLNN